MNLRCSCEMQVQHTEFVLLVGLGFSGLGFRPCTANLRDSLRASTMQAASQARKGAEGRQRPGALGVVGVCPRRASPEGGCGRARGASHAHRVGDKSSHPSGGARVRAWTILLLLRSSNGF